MMRRVEEIDASSFMKKTFHSAYGCSVNAKAEEKFVRLFETYWIDRLISRKWELFSVAYS